MSNQNTNSMSAPTGRLVRTGAGAFITVVMEGESLTVREADDAAAFTAALAALRRENWDALYQTMRPVKAFATKVAGVTVQKDGVYWNGEMLSNALATRIMDFALAGLDYKPLCLFLNKLMQNPSQRAVNELYKFLEHSNIPITDNGNFLAYKSVQGDWYSIKSGKATLIQGKQKNGKIYNAVGEVIEVDRDYVNDNHDQGCAQGLHAGSVDYTQKDYKGARTVIVEINPKDVVSVPSDYSFQKLRICRYKVVQEFTGAFTEPVYKSQFEDSPVVPSYYNERDKNGRFVSKNAVVPETQPRDKNGRFLPKGVQAMVDACNRATPQPGIQFNTDNSDWLASVEWFSADTRLVLNKRDGGEIVYTDVPQNEVLDFQDHVNDGESAGWYYNEYIKGEYTLA